jgi:hypothetical protein
MALISTRAIRLSREREIVATMVLRTGTLVPVINYSVNGSLLLSMS